jgi:hypothetical protein
MWKASITLCCCPSDVRSCSKVTFVGFTLAALGNFCMLPVADYVPQQQKQKQETDTGADSA